MTLYEQAVKKWGNASQLLQTIEECSELIKAIVKMLNREGSITDVIEEAVDVQLMLNQLRAMLPSDDWQRFRSEKTAYLRELLASQAEQFAKENPDYYKEVSDEH
jgi:Rod binding domain-containing protein